MGLAAKISALLQNRDRYAARQLTPESTDFQIAATGKLNSPDSASNPAA
ncbi:MAG TPA: hypothetical protein VFS34_01300 [Thermoanaerobaculia bacterium]|nr:hypothetical protein [Thermoanaerobaculia bacterium]